MSLHDDQKTFLPSLLADLNRGQDDPSSSRSSREHNYHYNQQQQHNYLLPGRQLPSLDSLQQQQQRENDDYIRIKLSGMSVGVSPNHSPRAHHLHQQQRGDGYFPAPAEETNSRRNSLVYDPIRSSANNTADTTPLIKRIIQQDTNFQRRHSIANLETRSSSFSSNPIHDSNNTQQHSNIYHPHQQHQQQLQKQASLYPYSAPSSPPLSHTNTKHTSPSSFSPYNRVSAVSKSSTTYQQDDPPPQMRRNSSAIMYQRRRMSSSSSSATSNTSSSLHRINLQQTATNHAAASKNTEQETEENGLLYSRSPELRISHKLAERKRRKEMKDLFEELKDALPVDKSMKTSKWEILSKAVEYIGLLRHRDYNMEQELIMLKHELKSLKNEKNKSYHTHRLQ